MGLYHSTTGAGTGVSLVPKLKYEHIHLTSFSKMRVDLAAQVHCSFTYFMRMHFITHALMYLDFVTL